jgi:DNA-binding CsgD family transcriptional regulator/tetratricopeptide (TPR) repeat protein
MASGRHSPALLVGREEEIARISSLLRETAKGSGATLLVAGEGGVGKTRLLTSAAESAQSSGWQTVFGRAYAVETGIPFALFADAFVPFLKSLEPSALSVLSRGGTPELAYLFPALGAQGNRERVAAGSDASELKARLQWNFAQFLGRLAARKPLLIVLENLQWADASSLELFHFVARQISSFPVAVLASYNETERDSNPVLRTTEQSLLGLGAATHMRLSPLSHEAIAKIVEMRFGLETASNRQFAALLYGWTRGNAFFVEETLKWLVESGTLREENGTWAGWNIEALNLPPTVRDAVGSRIDRLSGNAREIANVAAVVGARLTIDQLSALTQLDSSSVADALAELCSQRVLEEIPVADDIAYDFAHPILQQVTYAALGGARARLMHGAVAESLEKFYGTRAAFHAGELAFHFARSGALAPKAVKYLNEAGRTALDTYANREAAGFLSSALEQVESLDRSQRERNEIVRNLARARQRLGEYDEALKLWLVARDSAVAEKDWDALAAIEYRMGLACFWSGRFDDALGHYAAGIEHAERAGDKMSAVRLYLAKSICLQELGRMDAATDDAASALKAAEIAANPSLLSRAHRALLLLHAWTGPADVALDHGNQALAFAKASNEKMLEWTAHWGLGILGGLTGRASQALEHIRECQRLEEAIRSPLLPLWTAELSLQYASWLGEWDDGIATGERTIAQARALNQRTLLPRLLVWTGLIYLWRHDLERARSYFDQAWNLSGAGTATENRLDVQTVLPAHMGLAAYHLETDNLDEAIRIGEAGLLLADKLGYVAWTLQWFLPVIGEAALWNRDFERAERHTARMRRDGERLSNPIAVALADTGDGMLLLLRDANPKAAIPLLRSAIDSLEKIPLPDVASRIRRALAQALTESGDREGALQELRIAHDKFARIGAAGELENVRNEIRKLGSRPPPRTVTEGMAGLTGRELEIARMVAQRKSNKDIGSALDISARTVSTHLSNIFSKVGVTSRGELADFIREQAPPEDD